MSKLRHGYAIGTTVLNDHEFGELKKLSPCVSKEVRTFEQLFFNNVTIHTIHYHHGDSKQNNAYCCYRNDGVESFGEVQKLVECSVGTVAFIKPLRKTQSNILQTSGNPCGEVLELYAQTSLISKFIVEVYRVNDVPMIAVLVENIISNCDLVIPVDSSVFYKVKLPNNYEHH